MRCFSLGFSMLLLFGTVAGAQKAPPRSGSRSLPAETVRRYDQLHASLQPSVRNWVDEQARTALQRHEIDLSQLRSNVLQHFPTLNAGGSATGFVDPMALVQMVVMESYKQTTTDMENYALQVEFFNKLKQAIRVQMDGIHQELAAEGTRPKTAICATAYCRSLSSQLTNLNATSAGSLHPLHLQAPANPTYQNLQSLQANLENQLDSVGDDAQLANTQLQDAMQMQQQTMSVLSNMLKSLNDTEEAIIRNLK